MSIWDAPNPQSTNTQPGESPLGRDVPIGSVREPLLTGSGRGVKGGVPYGEQLKSEQDDLDAMYRLRPSFGRVLRAATRAALGR